MISIFNLDDDFPANSCTPAYRLGARYTMCRSSTAHHHPKPSLSLRSKGIFLIVASSNITSRTLAHPFSTQVNAVESRPEKMSSDRCCFGQ